MSDLRWYGWGNTDQTFPLEQRSTALDFLRAALDLNSNEKFLPCDFDSIRLRAPRLTDVQLRALRDLTSPGAVKTDALARVTHAYGKAYRDLIRLRLGEIPNPPDVVVFPSTEDQIARVIEFCANAENGFALIPFGGGSNSVGSVEPCNDRVTISLDLSRLNRMIAVDEISQTATIEAGVLGSDLERELNARGLTLGYFPPAFEFSTLGGWLATRYDVSTGLAHSIRVIMPSGVIETRNPSIMQLLIGSEGTLGVITQATIQVRALSKTKNDRAVLFKNFADGVQAVRAIKQNGITPTVVNLMDENATRHFISMREPVTGWQAFVEKIKAMFGNALGEGALLILGFDDDANANRALSICKSRGASDLGHTIANEWQRDHVVMPYLCDVLLDRGVLIDSLDVATSWTNLDQLHKAIVDVTNSLGSKIFVMTNLTRADRDGANLSITFLARMAQNKIEQWKTIHRALIECVVANGGAISPSVGIGYEYAELFKRASDDVSLQALQAIKNELDPNNVMNPGKWLETKQSSVNLALEYQERFWNLSKQTL